ncbi:hypothetical protein [Microbacterium sp. Leaf203]|uniref:hypothetical protein n=1 Tax=Microbacterium sp. Leaf203 TaxID=1735677 RepID=UPI0006F4ACA4|nr:hypothetical protein [Microbacterium sp. Leaf203]KQM36830.1 hypothetical protein ASE56_10470 [Microbacterium sp. Leaf203]
MTTVLALHSRAIWAPHPGGPFDVAERLILEQTGGFVQLGTGTHVALADWERRVGRVYGAVEHDRVIIFGHDETDHLAMSRMGVVAHQPLRAMVTDYDADEMANGIARLAENDGDYDELVIVLRAPYGDEVRREMRQRLDWLVPAGATVRGHLVDERLGALERDFLDLAGAGPREAGELLSILEWRPLDTDDAL